MAFVTADRVLDTSTSTGTGAIVVSGSSPNGYRTFSTVMTTSDTCYYSIQHQTLNEWETGTATYSSANTLTRTTIASSSNANAAVNFSAGTKDVSITFLASKSVQSDPSGQTVNSSGSYVRTAFTASAGQTSFTVSYTVNYVEVYVNGILLNSADYTASTGTTIVLAAAASSGDIVEVIALNIGTFTSGGYTRTTYTGTAGQTSFTAAYTPGYLEVFLNGVLLDPTDYTATSGSAVVLATGTAAGDTVDIIALNIGGFTGGVTVTGTPASGQIAAWTGSSSVQGIAAPTTAGNVLFTTDGTNWSSAPNIVRGTTVATTSGTSIDFTSIPSWVKRVTIMFNGVSTSGTSPFLIQLGAGSVTTTGYISTGQTITGGSGGANTSSTAGMVVYSSAAASISSGHMLLTTMGSNLWISSHTLKTTTAACLFGGGDVTLGGTLDRVRLTTVNGTDTFDAGSINILYE